MQWIHRTACAMLLVLVAGCGGELDTPGNIPIVVQTGRFADDATPAPTTTGGVVATPSTLVTAVSPEDGSTSSNATDTVLDAPDTLATATVMPDAALEPTRTLTETLESFITPVGEDTAAAATAEASLAAVSVGNLRATLRGVRVAALNADLTAPGDNHVLVVAASFENTATSPIVLQVGTDFVLRDAAGNQYTTELVARASAQAREPDTLVPVGGSVQGEIAYQVPNAANAYVWVIHNGGQQVTLDLPPTAFASPEATASALPAEETPSAMPSATKE